MLVFIPLMVGIMGWGVMFQPFNFAENTLKMMERRYFCAQFV
jgi:hypothetical protein